MTSTIVTLKRITKIYTLHHEKPTLAEKLTSRVHSQTYRAINDVSFSVKAGQRLGLIGPNGAGKTTLLRLICGLTQPTSGQITVYGRLVSLIDLSAGFHPDLTGWENIYQNGLLLGLTRSQIKSQFKQIVAVANIGSFIDVPMHTYSDGMKLRLGFAIAIHSRPQILVLDEHLSVGDQAFQANADRLLNQAFSDGLTLIIASHNLAYVETTCSHCIWLDQGNIISQGNAKKIIGQYRHQKA